jgi:uncharacterized protein YjiS (DUF1127 family)
MRTLAFTKNSMSAIEAFGDRLVAIALGTWHRYRAWKRRKSTENALQRLSDRTLRDIGLHRSQILSVARSLSEHRQWHGRS